MRKATRFPRSLRGRYFVKDWKRGTAKQYIQAVLVVWVKTNYFGSDAERIPTPVPVQIAFILGGIAERPFEIGNRRFVFAGPVEPRTGEWTAFEFDLHRTFLSQWGFLPESFRGFRLLVEARYDGRAAAEDKARATVFFDDLHLGD